ncbi:LamG-like jellyroll fold domain-containing protein [Streptomyces sp. NPDC096319]|uniref:LamG-like jellyroll fold domain-containing protein n=1 Tax=Streptomyces sp. NPDC096319 TaxID=3366084 RepID=UPI0037FDDB40
MIKLRSKPWRRVIGAVTAAVLLGAGQAAALETTPGDPTNSAYTSEPLRVMTWNVCGEAGGLGPWSTGYCPDRNTRLPDDSATLKKAYDVAHLVNQENADAVLLQEVCAGTLNSSRPGLPDNPSQLDQILRLLTPSGAWTAVSAVTPRSSDGKSSCRNTLSGDVSVAILVKGDVEWSRETPLPVPAEAQQPAPGKVLCAGVAGWETHLCTTHLTNYGDLPADVAAYRAQVDTVAGQVDDFRSVILGGDFNTRQKDRLQPLYRTMAECDQQSYHAGDVPDETTKVTHSWTAAPAGSTVPEGSLVQGATQTSKIDYLFATAGFGACDSRPDLADNADYSYAAQPGCLYSETTRTSCVPSGTSDHAPLLGSVNGGPLLHWPLRDASSHSGTVKGGVGWSPDHGGTAVLDGSTGEIVTSGPVVDTTRSFTVSAWAKVDAGAGTSVVLAQDGSYISGMMLWFNKPDSTWRFGLPASDIPTWNVHQAISATAAVPGRWTHLTGTFDASNGALTLYVDGVPAGSANHPDRWSAEGPFTVGRDKVSGRPNGFWKGSVQAVEVYGYPMTAAQVASAAGSLTAPTRTATTPATDKNGSGCHVGSYSAGDFGTVSSTTPDLTAHVSHPDPSREVWAEFSIWDNTDSTQPIRLGGPGSASGKVTGDGTVSVRPTLTAGHKYGWYARTVDGSSSPSPTGAVCHFTVAPAP